MTTAGLSEMEGLSAGRRGAAFCPGAAGAVCAETQTPRHSMGRSATRLIRDDLKNDRIVQLGFFFCYGSRNVDFQTVNQSWSNAGLALKELGSGLQGDAVEPKSE